MSTFRRVAGAFILALLMFVGAAWNVSLASEGLKSAVFFRPNRNDPFWSLAEKALIVASKDLGVELRVVLMEDDPFETVQKARDLVGSSRKPDLAIFPVILNVGPQMIEAFEKGGIDCFIMNAGLLPRQNEKVGKPREKYKHWIGQILPNDEEVGAQLAKILYERARAKRMLYDGNVMFLAIEGTHGSIPSVRRIDGMQGIVNTYDDLLLNGIVEGRWTASASKEAVQRGLSRYPRNNVVWAVNDETAIGAIAGIEAMGLKPGKDVLIGGIDWLPTIFDYIEDGRIEASFGGHFMEGVWALILAYDYKHGHDFAETEGVELHSLMQVIDKGNVGTYGPRLEREDWSDIDFKTLTKTHNPDMKHYNFNVLELLDQVKE